MKVCVCHGFTGNSLRLDVESETTVAKLKCDIETRWRIPPICQQLIIGTAVLRDHRLLRSLCEDDGNAPPPMITLVVDQEKVRQESIGGRMPTEALKAFEYFGTNCDEASVSTILQQLTHSNHLVRAAACEVLPKVCRVGDVSVISSLRGLLRSPNCNTASVALNALSKVGTVGDDGLVEAICAEKRLFKYSMLDDSSRAIVFLAEVTKTSDPRFVEAVHELFSSTRVCSTYRVCSMVPRVDYDISLGDSEVWAALEYSVKVMVTSAVAYFFRMLRLANTPKRECHALFLHAAHVLSSLVAKKSFRVLAAWITCFKKSDERGQAHLAQALTASLGTEERREVERGIRSELADEWGLQAPEIDGEMGPLLHLISEAKVPPPQCDPVKLLLLGYPRPPDTFNLARSS